MFTYKAHQLQRGVHSTAPSLPLVNLRCVLLDQQALLDAKDTLQAMWVAVDEADTRLGCSKRLSGAQGCTRQS
jgi:hypothetical protein